MFLINNIIAMAQNLQRVFYLLFVRNLSEFIYLNLLFIILKYLLALI